MKSINDLAFVMAIGIDQSPNGNEIMTVQIAVPSAAGKGGESGGGGSGSSEPIWVISANGHTLAECAVLLRKQIDRQLFYGHTKIIVFGSKRAQANIREDLDVLERFPQFRRSMSIFVANGDARAVLAAKPKLDPIGAIAMQRLAQLQSYNLAIGDFISQAESEEEDAGVPVFTTAPPEGIGFGEKMSGGSQGGGQQKGQKPESIPRLEGIAAFRAKRLSGFLSGEEAAGYLLFRRLYHDRALIVGSDRFGEAELFVRAIKSRSDVKLLNGKAHIHMQLNVSADVFQLRPSFDLDSPKIVSELEDTVGRQINKSVLAAAHRSQRLKSDLFGFGGELFRKNPKKWHTIRHQWSDMYTEAEITVSTKVTIQRSGSIIRPPEAHF